jgi:hypothetical protein
VRASGLWRNDFWQVGNGLRARDDESVEILSLTQVLARSRKALRLALRISPLSCAW